jgi:DNA repair protein RecN (Recombination protein N)
MLVFLQIRDFAIVDRLELELAPGFTCITGETGAGKSILVGALGLLSGNRADSSAVRQGCQKAELVAGFELDAGDSALAWLREAELDDGSDCLIRRVLHANGRSRAWVNGTPVTLQQLAELGSRLVEIHGQNEHLRLTRRSEAFRLLDSANEQALAETRARYFAWQELEREKQALLSRDALTPGDLDLLGYQLEELENDLLPPGEFTALETEHRKLARGSEIVAALEAALDVLQSGEAAASSTLHRAAGSLDEHGALDPDIAAAAGMIREAAINCDEAGASIQSALSRMDLSPERLAEVELRLGRQHDLARKHRAEPEQLQQVADALRERLARAADQDQRLAVIDTELEAALRTYRAAANDLYRARAERAASLSEGVTGLMQQLGMSGGRFELTVQNDPARAPSARGDDSVEVRVSANRGVEPGPLRKVASGGELSRIGLAVKIVSRQHGAAATQVFDEVDAGIGGDTATIVGALLRELAGDGQALCVTHLAQVAAFADRQIRVTKSDRAKSPGVRAQELENGGRVDEVARMLGGSISPESRAHAEKLLQEATAVRH